MRNLLTNPVLHKELRGRMRGNRALVILTIYLSIISVVTLLVYLAVVNTITFGAANPEAGRNIGKAIFLTVMIIALGQICIIVPALTSSAIAGEKERQSYDLLITTLLSPWQIMLGKLVSALSFASLLILAVLPLASLSFLFGGVSFVELLIAIVGLVVTALMYASVGLYWSTVMRQSQSANVMAQGTVFLWLLGVPFLFIVGGAIFNDIVMDLSESIVVIYLVGLALCSHPFIALGITESLISSGEGIFVYTFDPGPGEITVLSPWLVYAGVSLVITLVLLVLAGRRLVPVETNRRAPKKPEPPAAAPADPSTAPPA